MQRFDSTLDTQPHSTVSMSFVRQGSLAVSGGISQPGLGTPRASSKWTEEESESFFAVYDARPGNEVCTQLFYWFLFRFAFFVLHFFFSSLFCLHSFLLFFLLLCNTLCLFLISKPLFFFLPLSHLVPFLYSLFFPPSSRNLLQFIFLSLCRIGTITPS